MENGIICANMATVRDLTQHEVEKACEFFAHHDAVLDFNRITFCKFAVDNIGEMVADDEKMSVGEALRRFLLGAPVDKKLALLRALVAYYVERYPGKVQDTSSRGVAFRDVKAIVENAIGSGVAVAPRMILLGDAETEHLKRELILAQDAISRGDFGSAVTKAKAALEGSLKYAAVKAGDELKGHRDIPQLIALIRDLYVIPSGKDALRAFDILYKGVASAINAIAEIRNSVGDSHGRATPPLGISVTNARLYVNVSTALCEYAMSLAYEKESANDNA